MNTRKCFVNKAVGKLFVVSKAEPRQLKHKTMSVYRCVCDCGKFLNVDHQRLTRQKNASCGCVVNYRGRPRR